MRIPGSMAHLDIHSTRAMIHIENSPMRLVVDSSPAQMKVSRRPPKFNVDWGRFRDASGLRTPGTQAKYQAQQSTLKMQEGVDNMVYDYESIGMIENAGEGMPNTVGVTALNRALEEDKVEVNVASIPSEPLQADWTPGEMEITWVPHKLEMSWEGDVKPKITVTPHSVEIRLVNGETVRVKENASAGGQGKSVDRKI